MLFAAIDIGSNASRLLFANVFDILNNIVVEKATLVRIPTRLGEDVFTTGKVSPEKANNLIKTLQAYKLLMEVYEPLSYTACATAAIREAKNGNAVIRKIADETGITVKVIDGIEEAEIIRQSNKIEFGNNKPLSMYIDVGGGSTEISVVSEKEVLAAASFRVGTLRLLSNKVKASEWEKMEKWLGKFKNRYDLINCIGTGGNINKICKMYGDSDHFMLTFKSLRHAYDHLGSFTLPERIVRLGLRPDRADVILPAAWIFITIMKTIKARVIYVPKTGLADGLVHRLFEQYVPEI
ncbi:MAG: Ppx/GppA family phosphatase [Bacteroidales bacterium]|nr:Ppx/GppA family phosphatase [Bacteroidales bacterium]